MITKLVVIKRSDPSIYEVDAGTDPLQPDTDGDGMDDGWELTHGFDPTTHNSQTSRTDDDPLADWDHDGLNNLHECMWGSNPLNADSDNDGTPDGMEAGVVERLGGGVSISDLMDPEDEGEAASCVNATFRFGDPSGSHSEKYRLEVECVSGGGRSFSLINAQYGQSESCSVVLKPGCIYAVRLRHVSTDPEYTGTPRPDCDYELFIENLPQGALLVDPQSLFGYHNDDDGAFTGAGKVAWIRIPDEDGDVPGGYGEDGDYPYGPGGGVGGGGPAVFTMPRLSITFDGLAESLVGTGEAADAANPAVLRIRATDSLSARVSITAMGLENLVDIETGNAPVLPQVWTNAPLDIAISCTGKVSGVVTVLGEMRGNGVSGGRDAPITDGASLYVLGEPYLVFDYDRNGMMDVSDSEKARDGHTIFRFWVNDDHDSGNVCDGADYNSDCPTNSWKINWNCSNGQVDGKRDLVDFTPVWIDRSSVVPQNAPSWLMQNVDGWSISWRLKSDCMKAVWTSMHMAWAGWFQRVDCGCKFGKALNRRVERAESLSLEKGAVLPVGCVDGLGANIGKGVFLVEGYAEGTNLVLECTSKLKGVKRKVAVARARMKVSPVEEMYRWLNVRRALPGVPAAKLGIDSRDGDPVNWPDGECGRDGHIVFVHGFNVNTTEARASAAETFKRLWQSGLKSAFTAVEWYGDVGQFNTHLPWGTASLDYYANALHAFETAQCLATNLNQNVFRPRDHAVTNVVIAHSLGNILVSSAIKDHGLRCDRYYMLDAAAAMEAYDDSAMDELMVDKAWANVPTQYRASDWHSLFNGEAYTNDVRRTLNWRGRFSGIANAVNCYSTTEDVVGNYETNHWFDILSQSAWVNQEIKKGTDDWHMLNIVADAEIEGGWGINEYYSSNTCWYSNRKFTINVQNLSTNNVIEHPLFIPFGIHGDKMHSLGPYDGSDENGQHGGLSGKDWLCARFLADAIPATSSAAGANAFNSNRVSIGNIEMDKNEDKGGCMSNLYEWPRGRRERVGEYDKLLWQHSDFKNIAYYFVHKLFDKFVNNSSH